MFFTHMHTWSSAIDALIQRDVSVWAWKMVLEAEKYFQCDLIASRSAAIDNKLWGFSPLTLVIMVVMHLESEPVK